MAPIVWHIAPFDRLTTAELYTILAARSDVFVVEQNCVFLDSDGHDAGAWHLWGEVDGNLAAYCRLLGPGAKYPEASIGRVLTTIAFRRGGYGRMLMERALVECARLFPGHSNRIDAQAYLEGFYQSLGYHTISEPFDEDGIQHVAMRRPADPAPAESVTDNAPAPHQWTISTARTALERVETQFVEMFAHGTLLVEYYAPVRVDPQTPHVRDEVYVVVSGSGWFVNGDVCHRFGAGDTLFVLAGVVHRFEEFTDDFATWVFFYGPDGGEAVRKTTSG